MHPSRPDTLFMQKHWDVMRTDDAGDQWHEVSGNLPTDFGFAIDVHAHEPETIYVVPIKSDLEHYPLDGELRVYRSRTGGNEWEPLTKGLPQEHCYVNVLRDAMAVDSLDDCGVYFGTTGGPGLLLPRRRRHLGGDRPRPARRALRRGADAAVRIDPRRAARAPARARAGRRRDHGRGRRRGHAGGPSSTRSRRAYPVLRGTIRDHATRRRRAFVRFYACNEDLSHEPPDSPLPAAVVSGAEPLLVVGAMAGG